MLKIDWMLPPRFALGGVAGTYHAGREWNPDWGVVQLVGLCTVNADGGGSNPPAPAKFLQAGRLARAI